MKSFYEVLDVLPSATQREVKDAYRRKVKELHPDLNNNDPAGVEQVKQLVRAYETLGHPERRAAYDRAHRFTPHPRSDSEGFDYASYLRARTNDRESQSKLIFYDLLHDNPQEALSIFGTLLAGGDFELSRYLDREDFMDCAFLLAEEYEGRLEFGLAFDLLGAIVRFERQKPYFRHFMSEVYDRLRSIVCFKMNGNVPTAMQLRYLHQLIDWEISPTDTAFYYKKAAELLLLEGDRRAAARYLARAERLDPRVGGARRLRQQLGYAENADL